jgi:hypothetical protein
MVNRLWQSLAWLVATPPVREWLIRRAYRRPYLHIGDYMQRWWLMPRLCLKRLPDGSYFPHRWMPFAIRVHRILREDADPYLHDHPFNWRTIILDGWYSEENVFGTFTEHHAGSTRAARAETFHRIDMVSPGGVWTLFIVGRRRNDWGFMTGNPARKIYYRHYHSPNQRGDLTSMN